MTEGFTPRGRPTDRGGLHAATARELEDPPTVREEVLAALEDAVEVAHRTGAQYAAGRVDALRWVADVLEDPDRAL